MRLSAGAIRYSIEWALDWQKSVQHVKLRFGKYTTSALQQERLPGGVDIRIVHKHKATLRGERALTAWQDIFHDEQERH
jgi:hypothetical protein